jgi:hypothetical protein
MNSSSVRSGICRPDGAGEFGGVGGYKDFAPDGAAETERSRSTKLLEERVVYLKNFFAAQAKLLGLE